MVSYIIFRIQMAVFGGIPPFQTYSYYSWIISSNSPEIHQPKKFDHLGMIPQVDVFVPVRSPFLVTLQAMQNHPLISNPPLMIMNITIWLWLT